MSLSPILVARPYSTQNSIVAKRHRHAQGLVVGISLGLMTFELDIERWAVPSGHAVWIPPGESHGGSSSTSVRGWNIYVDSEVSMPSQPKVIRASNLLQEAALRALEWPSGPTTPSQERVALVLLDEVRDTSVEARHRVPIPTDTGLAAIASAILADPADARSLSQWATKIQVSPRTVSRKFMSETGMTFTSWRQHARLVHSIDALGRGLPITSVAYDTGFSTASAYIALFRQKFGETPAQFRQRLESSGQQA